MQSEFFIDIDYRQHSESGSAVSGDVCLIKKRKNSTVLVLSDGSGSGIKANLIASVLATMAVNYSLNGENPLRAAKSIIETFARAERSDDVNQATFTIATFIEGMVQITEFENPPIVVVRDGEILDINRKKETITLSSGIEISLYISRFKPECEDRMVLYSDGVAQSGCGTKRMPQGWGDKGVRGMICDTIVSHPAISAAKLAHQVIARSEINDLFALKNDICCAAVYFRKPRRVLVCTGPPFDKKNDGYIASQVAEYDGEVIVSGGTTAQILSRELKRDISVVMRRDPSGLPPQSKMEGVTMITEGVLTLAKVKALIYSLKNSDIKDKGIAAQYVRELLEHDKIDFLVGSSINAVHQDPSLPIELELRRNVIKEIGRLLETKFMKQVTIKYI